MDDMTDIMWYYKSITLFLFLFLFFYIWGVKGGLLGGTLEG